MTIHQQSINQYKETGRTLHLSGTPLRAAGKRAVSVVCTMADVIETPQTVPSERIKYTVDAETA